jgi:hypothetical protein
MGAPIKANKQTYYRTNTNLEQATYEQLCKIAQERDITFAAAMRAAIKAGLKRQSHVQQRD